ncbi:MAG: riboflavin biosynthesis protein RibF [Bacteroidota bacterium]|nr:riboflavin biosynthesis protein RibF [Bacteroidota bacterium]MDP4217736.1 riboflavin biosynthesis protein RibF [Bacteroidota bacterium]MDP4248074.1 riboflavin biosynthesis protein RibF [Bacteroidota bacterium]MDP4253706.1 riboflavin biosynthesis protein RibF [Bacteroidota bacterium]
MHVHRNIDRLPSFRRAVITIGTFDGVHTGHQLLIRQLKEEAARIDGETVIITFHPHPRKIIRGNPGALQLINTLDEKIGLLAEQGVDHLVVVDFTEPFSQLSAEQYVKDFLIGRFHPHTIIIGYDHQFGKGRQGNYLLLEKMALSEGFELQEIPAHLSHSLSVSSTRIREAILNGDMDLANELLGYPWFFSGKVIEGDKLGRTLGYPTANLQIADPEKLTPCDGVYAVEAEIWDGDAGGSGAESAGSGDVGAAGSGEVAAAGSGGGSGDAGARLKGMMNIGFRPTVGGVRRLIEVHLFDFHTTIYGRELQIIPRQYLRGEQKFAGLDALKEQLARDEAQARALLGAEPQAR